MSTHIKIGGDYIPKRPSNCGTWMGTSSPSYITITGTNSSGNLTYDIHDSQGKWLESCNCCFKEEDLIPKGGNMKLSHIAQQSLDKGTQALLKADYMEPDMTLTGTGKNALLTVIFQEKKAELVKLAEQELEEQEEQEEE